MAGIFALASLRGRRNACQPEDDAAHDGFGGGTAHHAAPAHLVPDLAVMVAAPFEKAGLAVGSVPDVNRGQDALELAEAVYVCGYSRGASGCADSVEGGEFVAAVSCDGELSGPQRGRGAHWCTRG